VLGLALLCCCPSAGSNVFGWPASERTRAARVVALTKPTEPERGQWYFHRCVAPPSNCWRDRAFDRSWYNRAGIEKVMGFCSSEEYSQFLRHAPLFEQMLVESGFSLTKLWF
jgi:polyphosphate kinase